MKLRTKLRSKMAVAFEEAFPRVYKRFTLKISKGNADVVESKLTKPLPDCRVALLTSAGVHLKKDVPFDVDSSGDYSYRIIPGDTEDSDLEVTHIYYNTKDAKVDKSIVFPLAQLRQLGEAGKIGSVSDVNIGVNGGTLKPGPHEQETAPEVARLLKDDGVDVVLLVPG
ncbi:glycine/sarcosine/betaine reductase selenoprotein B family protein [Alkalihalobacillus sp. AL-G]|uniref:glycine/sarcosine/betaine reductase selenoprotein B family protein n=1 Tax=Alkalihalobacillus sp. AL-G TaxID=2926399 RepID=UPI00272DC098|nr:glycine/sarcosine/betaine reductase selenoprotein B family protein [Alkalihalobacillus sp. AL-G]WLD92783.1 glycine/betaine/sarcosine/D-proline family reductase selenoprotein B [Alkalihalobacillus sp. AL-G]